MESSPTLESESGCALVLPWRVIRPDLDLIAHDVAHLRDVPHSEALSALQACLAGDNRPLRRWGYAITMDTPPAKAIAIVAEYSAGQAEAWLLTHDAQRRMVHD